MSIHPSSTLKHIHPSTGRHVDPISSHILPFIVADPQVPEAIQKAVPEGLERALPEAIHPTEGGKKL
jgi:hypothetical protein